MLRCQCPSVRLSVTEVHFGHGACREEGWGSSRAMLATAMPSLKSTVARYGHAADFFHSTCARKRGRRGLGFVRHRYVL